MAKKKPVRRAKKKSSTPKARAQGYHFGKLKKVKIPALPIFGYLHI
ncbi:MAG TPA: hypothetical protein VFV50_15520 [Bdellovibrionales bacterium]|nr:hypothetical protein [Bdellovibrionales bacterium]